MPALECLFANKRRKSSRAIAALVLVLSGCAPTLSKPRGAEHLDALADAERHEHHGRLSAAADAYDQAAAKAERRVDRDEALYPESRVRARLGELERALAICDRIASELPPSRRTLRAKLDASRYRLKLSQTERAENDLRAIIREAPESGEAKSALRILLENHVEATDHAQGLAFVREMQAFVGQNHLGEALMFRESELHIALGQPDEARRVLEVQVERYPYPEGHYWDDALSRLADLAIDRKDPRAAIAYLERMIDVHESSFVIGSYTRTLFPKSALRIARIYRDELKDVDAAISAYREVRDEFPKSLVADDALLEQAELMLARGDKSAGCALLRELVEEHEVGAARRNAEARIAGDCR